LPYEKVGKVLKRLRKGFVDSTDEIRGLRYCFLIREIKGNLYIEEQKQVR